MTSFGESGDISRLAIFVFRHGVSVVTHLEVDVEVEVEGGEAGIHHIEQYQYSMLLYTLLISRMVSGTAAIT